VTDPLLRPPAFAAATDPARLLAAVADALNALERAGITCDLAGGAVMTDRGYVMAVGDGRLGNRWQARTRLWTPLSPEDSSDED
jgi:hypothetical protein